MKLTKKVIGYILIGLLALPSFASPASSPSTQPTQQPTQQQQNKVNPFVLDNFKVIATTLKDLGVTQDELMTYIREGKKLEDVLKVRKIPVKKFKKTVLIEYYKVVDEGVAKKQLSEEQATQLKTAIQETVKGWLPKK